MEAFSFHSLLMESALHLLSCCATVFFKSMSFSNMNRLMSMNINMHMINEHEEINFKTMLPTICMHNCWAIVIFNK